MRPVTRGETGIEKNHLSPASPLCNVRHYLAVTTGTDHT